MKYIFKKLCTLIITLFIVSLLAFYAFALIGSMAPNDRRLRCEVDDAINGIVSASSLLGFYIGVQTGADMERHISDSGADFECVPGA